MKFTVVGQTTDLAPGTTKPITVEGQKLVLANVGGQFYAIAQKCPHLGGNLSKGTLNGTILSCPLHKAGFDVISGAAVDPAKILFLKMKTKNVSTYDVKIQGEDVLVGV